MLSLLLSLTACGERVARFDSVDSGAGDSGEPEPAPDTAQDDTAEDDTAGEITTDTGDDTGDTGGIAGDLDGDGYPAPEDCDDADAELHPGATEQCGDGVDANCDGEDPAACGFKAEQSLSDSYATLEGEASDDWAGRDISGRCDLDGDEFGDMVVGAPLSDGLNGAAYVINGPVAAGLTSLSMSQSILAGGLGTYAGAAVSCGGDADGDGLDDILVATLSGFGAAYVVLSPVPLGTSSIEAADWTMTGGPAGVFGYSVSLGGDFDGNGVDDLLIATSGDGGGVAVINGPIGSGNFSHGDADSALGGVATHSVAAASDVNGDGLDDILAGSSGNNRANLVLGPAAPGATDLAGTADATWAGEAANDMAGIAVGSGGDLDADGFADIVIGASATNVVGIDDGSAYVVLGSATPLGGSLSSAFARFDAELRSDQAGCAAGGVGDVNGDGFADLGVGAQMAGPGDYGAAYLVFGPLTAGTASLSTADSRFTGPATTMFSGQRVAAGGDLDANGVDDMLVSAPTGGPGYVYVLSARE